MEVRSNAANKAETRGEKLDLINGRSNQLCTTNDTCVHKAVDSTPTLSHGRRAATRYSFIPNALCTRIDWRMLRSNMISSLPPGMAYARTSRYSRSTLAP